jgi:hypothetical protein
MQGGATVAFAPHKPEVQQFQPTAIEASSLLIAVTGVVFLWLGVFPTASYRYRLT